MDLNTILLVVDRFGLVLKDTKIDYREIYGEWDSPVGFYVTLTDPKHEVTLQGSYILPEIPKRKLFFGLGNNTYIRKIEKLIVREGPLTIHTIDYSDFLKAVNR